METRVALETEESQSRRQLDVLNEKTFELIAVKWWPMIVNSPGTRMVPLEPCYWLQLLLVDPMDKDEKKKMKRLKKQNYDRGHNDKGATFLSCLGPKDEQRVALEGSGLCPSAALEFIGEQFVASILHRHSPVGGGKQTHVLPLYELPLPQLLGLQQHSPLGAQMVQWLSEQLCIAGVGLLETGCSLSHWLLYWDPTSAAGMDRTPRSASPPPGSFCVALPLYCRVLAKSRLREQMGTARRSNRGQQDFDCFLKESLGHIGDAHTRHVRTEECQLLHSRERFPYLLVFQDEADQEDGVPRAASWVTVQRPRSSWVVKADDDLRQEFLAMQSIHIINFHLQQRSARSIFEGQPSRKVLRIPTYDVLVSAEEKDPLVLRRGSDRDGSGYHGMVQAIGPSASLHEVRSFVARNGCGNAGKGTDEKVDSGSRKPRSSNEEVSEQFSEWLHAFFQTDPSRRENMFESLVASAVVSYVLRLRDRHNGNVILTEDGQLINVDFGFFFQRAPGGEMFSLENDNFRIQDDIASVLFTEEQGAERKRRRKVVTTSLWTDFKASFAKAVVECGESCYRDLEQLLLCLPMELVQTLPCFDGRSGLAATLEELQVRLVETTEAELLKRAESVLFHKGNTRYDRYQYSTNGVF